MPNDFTPEDFTDPSKWGGMTEPSAANRGGATELYGMYDSYVKAGFTEDEALRIVIAIVTEMIRLAQNGD